MQLRTIPSSGEKVPVIGMGTWATFDVAENGYETIKDVLSIFHKKGGRVIDSSPMYGKSEKVIGEVTADLEKKDELFYATKVWIEGKEAGIEQMNSSMKKMKRRVIDLIQIHNLVDWKTHLKTLRQWKEKGKVRYIGITHYTDNMHEALAKIIREEDIDFVQFNYSITDRHAEQLLLPLAEERGVATLINRPFGEGRIFKKFESNPLPLWAEEHNIKSWSQLLLVYIIMHPAVTCVIPATGDPEHALENMQAAEIKLTETLVTALKKFAAQL